MANMTNSEFTRLLTQAAKAAEKHKLLIGRVNEESVARYGVPYGDVDADSIIDVLDYIGGDSFTEKQFHEAMLRSDCERIDLKADELKSKDSLSEEEEALLAEITAKLNQF